MKRLACILCTLLLCAACFVGCGAEKDPFDRSKTLSILGKKSDVEKSYMQKLFALYEEETGNTLDVVPIEDALFESTASKYFAQGDAPDILMHFHNADLSRFDVQNNFVNLAREGWTDDLTDSARAYCTDKSGTLLGLPFWESSISGCYYNKAILSEYGFNPATSQAEFDVLCQSLKEVGCTPILWAQDCSWMYQFALDPVFCDHPETLEELNSGKINYSDIPAFEDMVNWIKGAAEKGWFFENFLEMGWDDLSSALSEGKAAMTFIWDTWFYTDFKEGKYKKEDFGVMPVFMGTEDGGTYEGGNLNMLMVNKNSERRDEALAFLEFAAQPNVYNECFDGIATVGSFKQMTKNVESCMVKEAKASIAQKERVSTASTRIVGYSAEDMAKGFSDLFQRRKDVKGLIEELDSLRRAEIAGYSK